MTKDAAQRSLVRRQLLLKCAEGGHNTTNLLAELAGLTTAPAAAGLTSLHLLRRGKPRAALATAASIPLGKVLGLATPLFTKSRTAVEQSNKDTLGRAFTKLLVPGVALNDLLKRIGSDAPVSTPTTTKTATILSHHEERARWKKRQEFIYNHPSMVEFRKKWDGKMNPTISTLKPPWSKDLYTARSEATKAWQATQPIKPRQSFLQMLASRSGILRKSRYSASNLGGRDVMTKESMYRSLARRQLLMKVAWDIDFPNDPDEYYLARKAQSLRAKANMLPKGQQSGTFVAGKPVIQGKPLTPQQQAVRSIQRQLTSTQSNMRTLPAKPPTSPAKVPTPRTALKQIPALQPLPNAGYTRFNDTDF